MLMMCISVCGFLTPKCGFPPGDHVSQAGKTLTAISCPTLSSGFALRVGGVRVHPHLCIHLFFYISTAPAIALHIPTCTQTYMYKLK